MRVEGKRKGGAPPPPRFPLPLAVGLQCGRGLLTSAATGTLLLLLVAGCAKHKKPDEAKKKDKGDETPVKNIGVGAGFTPVWQSSDPKSPLSFTVGWTTGGFNAVSGNVDTGHLVEPHGHLFQNGKPSSTYRGDTGDAVRAIKRLNIRGHVVVQSLDKTQTLTSDRGEYRGDVKLIRAIGHVVAKGPSGTLSGSPELWATPDLKLIGTPEMVAKTLKLSSLATLAATTAVGKPAFQGSDIKIDGAFPQTRNLSPKGYELTLVPAKGHTVVVTLPSRHMVITSAGTVVILTDPKGQVARHMTSQGTAHVVQTSDTGTTTMDGNGSVYDLPANAEVGTLDVGGRVTLTSESRGKDEKGKVTTQTTVSKGDKGRALLLAKPPKGGDSLKEAILIGNVITDSKGNAGGTFGGTGERMVYTPRSETADVDLVGSPAILTSAKAKDDPNSLVVTSDGPVAVRLDDKTKQVLHMTSQNKAHVVQTSDTGTTTMDGDGSVYDAPVGSETGTLDVGGRVTLTSESRSKDEKGKVTTQTTVSKGDKGRALLLVKPPKDTDALKEGILDGNATIDSKGSEEDTFHGTGDHLVYVPHGPTADADLTGHAVLTRVTTGKDGTGKPTSQTVVSRGERAHAVLDAQGSGTSKAAMDPKAKDQNPLKAAVLTGGTVAIDVSGSDGQTFKGTGDKVVYTATGGGNGKAVMTGDLKFSGDAPSYLGDVNGADIATVLIGKAGWKTVNLDNSSGDPTTSNIETRNPPPIRKPSPTTGGKKKKGTKG